MEHAPQSAEREVAPAPAPKAAPEQALPAAPGFSAGSGFLGGLEGAPPLMRASVIGRLQRAAGNRAVSRALLARAAGRAAHRRSRRTAASTAAGRRSTSARSTTRRSSTRCPPHRRGRGRDGERALEHALGMARDRATSTRPLPPSIGTCPDLLDDFDAERRRSRPPSRAARKPPLGEQQFVMEEMAKLGLPTEASFDSAGTPEDQAKRLAEVKAIAAEAQRALRAKQDLLGIRVGLNGSAVDDGASGAPSAFDVVTFNPDASPRCRRAEEGFRPGTRSTATGPSSRPRSRTWRPPARRCSRCSTRRRSTTTPRRPTRRARSPPTTTGSR